MARYFYSSSACVYNVDKQRDPNNPGLKEEDAYPALAEDGYGWEKLFSERMCRHFREDFGLHTRVARFHNVYGPLGTWDGGREKAPAAICRKVIEAKVSGRHEIAIWGDGTRTRSFMYIDDCVKGGQLIMNSDILEPINLGSSEMVSVSQLVDIVEDIAGIQLHRRYDVDAPKGGMGRNSDNTLIRRAGSPRSAWRASVGLCPRASPHRPAFPRRKPSGRRKLCRLQRPSRPEPFAVLPLRSWPRRTGIGGRRCGTCCSRMPG